MKNKDFVKYFTDKSNNTNTAGNAGFKQTKTTSNTSFKKSFTQTRAKSSGSKKSSSGK